MKLWGGRFEEGPSEVFERFSGSLDFDRRLIHADIQGSQAFARALESVGILTAVERAQLVDAFDEMGRAANAPEFYTGATDEDVHTLVIRKLKERGAALHVIMLTVYENSDRIFEALAAGACGYLVKNTPPEKLLEAIQDIWTGGSPMSSHIARKVVQAFQSPQPAARPGEHLAPREEQVP